MHVGLATDHGGLGLKEGIIAQLRAEAHDVVAFGAHGLKIRGTNFPAAFAVSFAARNVLGMADGDYQKYYPYFSNRRHFVLPAGLARIIGKPALLSLSNGWAKFYQVDKHRKPPLVTDEF